MHINQVSSRRPPLNRERYGRGAPTSSISLMALSSLLLPSSSKATDTPERRRQQQHHGKRKKKPPPSPSPLRSFSPATMRTPPSPALSSASRRGASRKSPAKSDHRLRHSHSKKTAAAGGKPVKPASAASSSWEQLKSLLSCRSATAASRVHDPAALTRSGGAGAWSASLCSMRDVAVDGASSAASVDHRDTAPLNRSSRRHHRAPTSSSTGGGGGHPSSLRGLSGCYECRAINVEPVSRRYPRPRELCPCSQCGEVFTKAESLEQHQAIRHAVSELGPDDSGRNIVEIIFKSSWQKRGRPICQVDRILKVHNRPRTVARFEAYRDAVRARCRAAAPSTSSGTGSGTASRAAADGNELLRFHPAGLACALGAAGSASLCSSADEADGAANAKACGVCAAIRHGFAPWAGAHPLGVRTTASSGRAHDCGAAGATASADWRAMLVCRVIAGQVRRDQDGGGQLEGAPFDSVAGEVDAASSAYGTLEELFVANPRAILPCFVVIYRVDAAQ